MRVQTRSGRWFEASSRSLCCAVSTPAFAPARQVQMLSGRIRVKTKLQKGIRNRQRNRIVQRTTPSFRVKRVERSKVGKYAVASGLSRRSQKGESTLPAAGENFGNNRHSAALVRVFLKKNKKKISYSNVRVCVIWPLSAMLPSVPT